MKKIKYRKCKICRKKVNKDENLHMVLRFDGKKEKVEFYHYSCWIKMKYEKA